MVNDYFCTVAEKLAGPADKILPLHAHSRENVDTTDHQKLRRLEKAHGQCHFESSFR